MLYVLNVFVKNANVKFDHFVVIPIIITFLTQQSYCSDPDLVLELKNLIVIFADTLQVHVLVKAYPCCFSIIFHFIDIYINIKRIYKFW